MHRTTTDPELTTTEHLEELQHILRSAASTLRWIAGDYPGDPRHAAGCIAELVERGREHLKAMTT